MISLKACFFFLNQALIEVRNRKNGFGRFKMTAKNELSRQGAQCGTRAQCCVFKNRYFGKFYEPVKNS
jgi:hypothetical protein